MRRRTSSTGRRQNAELSGLAERPIRWIAEDAMKFCQREVKRGNQYDARDSRSAQLRPRAEGRAVEDRRALVAAACNVRRADGRESRVRARDVSLARHRAGGAVGLFVAKASSAIAASRRSGRVVSGNRRRAAVAERRVRAVAERSGELSETARLHGESRSYSPTCSVETSASGRRSARRRCGVRRASLAVGADRLGSSSMSVAHDFFGHLRLAEFFERPDQPAAGFEERTGWPAANTERLRHLRAAQRLQAELVAGAVVPAGERQVVRRRGRARRAARGPR